MFSVLALAFAIFSLSIFSITKIQALRRNITEAKLSGFHYLVLPFSPFAVPWLFVQPLLVPALNRLPRSWTQPRLALLQFTRAWHDGYIPFRDAGADTFMAVFPSGKMLFTCDPEVSLQFLRSTAVGKPLELLALLNVFGPHITGTDGQEARLYRKITAPFFNEDVMQRLWDRSVSAAGSFLLARQGQDEEMRPVLARMTLHILNALCFEDKGDCLDELRSQERIAPGHELSCSKAMAEILENLPTVFITPSIILNYSPLPVHRNARQAYNELHRYMAELRDCKERDIKSGNSVADSSLLDSIVRASMRFDTQPLPHIHGPAVLGNIFVFMFAGHEANANTLHFLFVLLACHPNIQALLHADIDLILGSSPLTQWTYEAHYSTLSTSYVGAVINETSRLFGVLPYLPKTSPPTLQDIIFDNESHLLPANTCVLINIAAIHSQPALWPSPRQNDSTTADTRNPVASFTPARWLGQSGTEFGEDRAKGFLHPAPGTYLPFSDGHRGCLGKRFALVELVAVVAAIFSENSVELAVDYTKDSSKQGRKKLWEQAREKAEYEMSEGIEFKLSLRMSGNVPIRFVKRNKQKLA